MHPSSASTGGPCWLCFLMRRSGRVHTSATPAQPTDDNRQQKIRLFTWHWPSPLSPPSLSPALFAFVRQARSLANRQVRRPICALSDRKHTRRRPGALARTHAHARAQTRNKRSHGPRGALFLGANRTDARTWHTAPQTQRGTHKLNDTRTDRRLQQDPTSQAHNTTTQTRNNGPWPASKVVSVC